MKWHKKEEIPSDVADVIIRREDGRVWYGWCQPMMGWWYVYGKKYDLPSEDYHAANKSYEWLTPTEYTAQGGTLPLIWQKKAKKWNKNLDEAPAYRTVRVKLEDGKKWYGFTDGDEWVLRAYERDNRTVEKGNVGPEMDAYESNPVIAWRPLEADEVEITEEEWAQWEQAIAGEPEKATVTEEEPQEEKPAGNDLLSVGDWVYSPFDGFGVVKRTDFSHPGGLCYLIDFGGRPSWRDPVDYTYTVFRIYKLKIGEKIPDWARK